MSFCSLLGAHIEGQGPQTVVFGNGFSTTQHVWDAVLPTVPAGWRIVRFDYVGTTPASERSWLAARYESYAGHADDLLRLLAELDVRNALFVGHSMSGMVGAIAATQAPERFGHLLLIGASPHYLRDATYDGGFTAEEIEDLLARANADLAAWMGGFAPHVLGADATPQQLSRYCSALLAIRPDIGRTLLQSIFLSDYRPLLSSVVTDVSLVHGLDDVAVPAAVGRYLAAHLPCRAYHELSVPGHLPHVTHPDLIAPILQQTLADFTRRHETPRA
jgi:sigma-B regulation protein RsbQ